MLEVNKEGIMWNQCCQGQMTVWWITYRLSQGMSFNNLLLPVPIDDSVQAFEGPPSH